VPVGQCQRGREDACVAGCERLARLTQREPAFRRPVLVGRAPVVRRDDAHVCRPVAVAAEVQSEPGVVLGLGGAQDERQTVVTGRLCAVWSRHLHAVTPDLGDPGLRVVEQLGEDLGPPTLERHPVQ